MNLIHLLTDVGPLIGSVGLVGLLAIVFAETGILLGFFLPGDSLLFMAGLLAVQPGGFAPLWLVCVLVPIAAVAGDQFGFFMGRKFGPPIFERSTVKWMGPDAVTRTQEFFARYGPRTVFIARFVPIVRTLAPVMAGTAQMRPSLFVRYNVVGGIVWGVGMVLLGAWLGGIEFIRTHIDLIVIGIVLVSLVPVVLHLVQARRASAAADTQA